MKRASTMIAESLGMDAADMSEYRYQRYTLPAVYAIGDNYFAASVSKPKHAVGGEWALHSDQFGARDSSMQIWVAKAA